MVKCEYCGKEIEGEPFVYGRTFCNEAEFHAYITDEIQKKRDYEVRFAKEQEEKQQQAFKQTKTKQSGFYGKDNIHEKPEEESTEDDNEDKDPDEEE